MSTAVTQHQLSFHPLKVAHVDFDAPDLTSDGGLLLLRLLDEQQQVCSQIASHIPDLRRANSVHHDRTEQTRQRLFSILQGYVDGNDADKLANDPMFKYVLDHLPTQDKVLSSQSTICRFEHAMTKESIPDLRALLETCFVNDLPAKSREVVLDLDGTWDPAHGTQQGALFSGYYEETGFFPLLVFDASGRLASTILRPGNNHDSTRALEILTGLIRRIRLRFPTIKIIIRGDSAFSDPEIMKGLETLKSRSSRIEFLFGIKGNSRLQQLVRPTLEMAKAWKPGQRQFLSFHYKANSWPHPRRIIARILASQSGPQVRFVVTTLSKQARRLYVDDYCQRGQAENYIKEIRRNTRRIFSSSSGNYANSPRRSIRHSAKSPFPHCAPRCSRSPLVFAHRRGVSISNFPVTTRTKRYLAASLQP